MSSRNVDDRLSMMPEDIVSHILSLMPTKYAVRTSILSQRWRYRWMFVTNLDFDDIHPFHGKKTFTTFVNRVMKSCKSSQVRLFRLHFSRRWDQNPCVSYWIYKAVMLNVCELDIYANIIKLPLSLFNCKTLTTLRLHSRARDWSLTDSAWRFPSQVNLPCLITLDIVVTFTPFDYVYKLICGCPMLENLSLEVASPPSRNEEKEYVYNIPTLKRLKLEWVAWDKYPIDIVVLDVPNLEYLYIRGKLCSTFVMEDFSSLVEASVSFSTLTKLSLFNCKTLTKLSVHQHCEYKTAWEFPCQFTLPCLNTLDIDLSVTPFANVVELIHSCPMLEILSLQLSSSTNNREKYYVFDIPTLKRLKLNWGFGGYPNIVGLDVPNLKYLFVGGKLCSYFVMEDTPSLVEASVSFDAIESSKMWEELLKILSSVKSLSVQIPGSRHPFKSPFATHVPSL